MLAWLAWLCQFVLAPVPELSTSFSAVQCIWSLWDHLCFSAAQKPSISLKPHWETTEVDLKYLKGWGRLMHTRTPTGIPYTVLSSTEGYTSFTLHHWTPRNVLVFNFSKSGSLDKIFCYKTSCEVENTQNILSARLSPLLRCSLHALLFSKWEGTWMRAGGSCWFCLLLVRARRPHRVLTEDKAAGDLSVAGSIPRSLARCKNRSCPASCDGPAHNCRLLNLRISSAIS